MKQLLALFLSIILVFPALATNVSEKMEARTVLMHMKIKRNKTGKEGWGTCSAVYVEPNVLLSAAHCVNMPEGISLVEVWIRQGGVSDRAVVIKTDPSLDLSLLYTPHVGTPVKLARSVKRGQDCFIIGNPLGIEDVITKGIVSKANLTVEGLQAQYLLLDAVALPGNSGGAVVDSHGRLIGILVMSTSLLGPLGASGLGIAVSVKNIREFLK